MICFLLQKMLRSEGRREDHQKLRVYPDVLAKLLLHIKMNSSVSVSVPVQDWSEKTMQIIDCRTSGEKSIVGL